MEKMNYIYFISYSYQYKNTGGGSGMTSIAINHEIYEIETLVEIAKGIEERNTNFEKVVILNYKLLRKEREENNG